MKPVVAITIGDANGIGPEVILKAIRSRSTTSVCHPLLVGPWSVFRYYAHRLRITLPELHIVEPSSPRSFNVNPGVIMADSGRVAANAIRRAVELIGDGLADAMVTAPVSKTALRKGGINFPGQTEFLQFLTNAPRVAMMLVAGSFRIGLVTIHEPLRRVAGLLTTQRIADRILTVHSALRSDWRITRPRIAVLGLNPHAGEAGHLGSEEDQVITPAIRHLRARSIRLEGPFPADSFFARGLHRDYDAVMAMYHDQGLIPLKMAADGKGVNVTLGLPIVRTSPDHGTAFDIAGKGMASPDSLIEAIRTAAFLANNRRRKRR